MDAGYKLNYTGAQVDDILTRGNELPNITSVQAATKAGYPIVLDANAASLEVAKITNLGISGHGSGGKAITADGNGGTSWQDISVTSANNVTEKIGNNNITDILESDGTTIKKANNAIMWKHSLCTLRDNPDAGGGFPFQIYLTIITDTSDPINNDTKFLSLVKPGMTVYIYETLWENEYYGVIYDIGSIESDWNIHIHRFGMPFNSTDLQYTDFSVPYASIRNSTTDTVTGIIF